MVNSQCEKRNRFWRDAVEVYYQTDTLDIGRPALTEASEYSVMNNIEVKNNLPNNVNSKITRKYVLICLQRKFKGIKD